MILELAERGGKYVYVPEYKRKRTVSAHKRRKPNLRENYNPFVYIPAHLSESGEGFYLREDHLDHLSDNAWSTLMDNVLDYQPGLAELAKGGRKARKEAKRAAKAEKKAAREQRKADKNERKNKRRESKDAARAAKAEAKKMKAQAKIDKANNGGGGASDIFDSIVDKAAGVYSKFKGGEDTEAPEGSDGGDDSGAPPKKGSDSEDTIFGIPKNIAIGGGVVVGLGLLYLATRKKAA